MALPCLFFALLSSQKIPLENKCKMTHICNSVTAWRLMSWEGILMMDVRDMAKKASVILSDEDVQLVDQLKRMFGQRSDAGILRLCLRLVAQAKGMAIDALSDDHERPQER
jgi:hypothetical protein